MKAFFQRIIAFFMTIAAFFTGLFGPKKPEPTTQIESTTLQQDIDPSYQPKIVSTMAVFGPGYPAEDGIDRMARLGFEGLDLPFAYWVGEDSPFMGDNYLTWAASLKRRAESKGISFIQAHAPLDEAHDYVERTIRAAGALGAKYLVVHPTYRVDNATIEDQETFIHVNVEEIRQWLPIAQESGVILLSENVLWGASADPRIIANLVKAVDSPWFSWCFDTGHAHTSGYTPAVLKECAAVPLSLHIQDGDGIGDKHLIPGDGTIDWKLFTQTLKEIGYRGDCTLEAHHQCMDAPDSERDAILARLLTAAQGIRAEMK